MQTSSDLGVTGLFGSLGSFLRRCLFCMLSIGPIPQHFAFIMDGNRRYAKKENLEKGAGHKAGLSALMSVLNYCYELGVKYVTVYAFSIDNFKRQPEEVQGLMDLMLEKIEGLLEEESIVNHYGIRVYFIGSLKLLGEPIRVAAEKVMRATANNTKCVLLICIAYTSCDEIAHAVQESCKDKRQENKQFNSCRYPNGEAEDLKKIDALVRDCIQESREDTADATQVTKASTVCNGMTKEVQETHFVHPVQGPYADIQNEAQALRADCTDKAVFPVEESRDMQEQVSNIKLVDIEKHMYMAVAPDPDVVIRSSGESRLSNFLLWQTSYCLLYSPDALWPEIGLWHLVWAVLNFQYHHAYLEKKRKQF